MVLLPVIDLQDGMVVHGRAGQRDSYRPVRSSLCADAEPASVAEAFQNLGFDETYVADLDAIGGQAFDRRSLDVISRCFSRIWIDAGTGDLQQAEQMMSWAGGRDIRLVCGLESLPSPQHLEPLVHGFHDQLVVSLDLVRGQVKSPVARWASLAPDQVARELIELGVSRLILLDLSRVGVDQGTGTRELCRRVRQFDEGIELICGGGVRDSQDIRELLADGCQRVLVASTLHDGRLGVSEVKAFAEL